MTRHAFFQDEREVFVDHGSLDEARCSCNGEEPPREQGVEQQSLDPVPTSSKPERPVPATPSPDSGETASKDAITDRPSHNSSDNVLQLQACGKCEGIDADTPESGMPIGVRQQSNEGCKGLTEENDDCAASEGSLAQPTAQAMQPLRMSADTTAVEIGVERYLGMAEASKDLQEDILREALHLAVADRINSRM
jgi:hypothetical protein